MTSRYVTISCTFLFLFSLNAETFSERFSAFDIKVPDIFYEPQTDTEKDVFTSGQYSWWRSYSKGPKPAESDYKGYVLFADPIHIGQQRISFLLGADCSHFVHRLYQLLGADFPFAKTRHWLVLAKENPERPADVTECRWNNLKNNFQKVSLADIQVGDVMVYAKVEDELGERGHMGIVASTKPFLFFNVRNQPGYIIEEWSEEKARAYEPHFLRFNGSLREVQSHKIKDQLRLNFVNDNSGCN